MTIDYHSPPEPFSTYPNEGKLGYDKEQCALELQQNLDLVISLNQKSSSDFYDDEVQFATVVENSYRLIHEYATSSDIPGVMSRSLYEETGPSMTRAELSSDKSTENERLELVCVIQSWILEGKNPLNEFGLVDGRELIKLSSNREPLTLHPVDKQRFFDAMELCAQDYANSAKKGYDELEDNSIQQGLTTGFFDIDPNKEVTQREIKLGRIIKIGHAISGFFKPKKESSHHEQRGSKTNSK